MLLFTLNFFVKAARLPTFMRRRKSWSERESLDLAMLFLNSMVIISLPQESSVNFR